MLHPTNMVVIKLLQPVGLQRFSAQFSSAGGLKRVDSYCLVYISADICASEYYPLDHIHQMKTITLKICMQESPFGLYRPLRTTCAPTVPRLNCVTVSKSYSVFDQLRQSVTALHFSWKHRVNGAKNPYEHYSPGIV